MHNKPLSLLIILPLLFLAKPAAAQTVTSTPATGLPFISVDQLKAADTDHDGLSDYDEIYIYHTNPNNPDTDGDGFTDGAEVNNGFDPNKNFGDKLQKEIDVDLSTQTLTYFLGPYQIGKILVSTGVKYLPTPPGEYSIIKKIPVVRYKGINYDYPNTKWNLQFKFQKQGSLYIHGAYWHHNFGHPMSHGCVNVSYADMEPLYNWADMGTKVVIN
jgi:lipoprotein-anchoring transpeptidase ErfK/SrfK